MFYEQMLHAQQKVEKQIESLEEQLKNFPDGKLICSRNGKYSKWQLSDGSNQTYLPKSERRLAEQLAVKRYLTLQLENLLHEKKALECYLKNHDVNACQKEQSFINSPGFQELLSNHFKPLSQKLSDWMNTPYEKNPSYPEHLIHKTYSGELVRSKSESIIAMALYKSKIPFRYECILQLGKTTIFPDFTIRHPETGEFFYWEHFGLMDDLDYCKKAYAKLQLYTSHKIYPTIQLITTYETKEHPLSSDLVEKTINHYFL